MSDYDNIRNALNYLDPNDRDFWIRIGAAIKDHQGEEGFTLWDDWSRHSDSYKPSDAKAVWKSLKPGHIRINTLFYHARENGYRPEKPYTPPTAEELAARQAAARARRAEAERQEIQQREKARRTAGYIWTQAAPADPSHPYLKSKGINNPVLLSGIRQNEYKGSLNLVVPVYHEGRLANIQTIGADGGKRFLNGGQVKGGYSVVGSVDDMAKGLVIAEGFATAASIHAATGRPVIVAFNAGNMVAVAEKLAQTLPQNVPVTIAADNDASQTGIQKAREAAALLGSRARAVQPEFTMTQIRDYQRGHSGDGTPPLPSDFNDLHLLAGLDAVRQAVEYGHNLAPERQPETTKPAVQANLTATGNTPFVQAVDKVVSGNVPAGYISLGTTPDVLQMLGVPQGKVRILGGTIEKSVADYLNRHNAYDKNRHAVNPEDLKLLPGEMNDPVAVFKSSTQSNSFVVLIQLYERENGKEKPMIAAVHLSKGKGKHGVDLIDVVSVYGRSDTQLERAFQNDLLYTNEKKVREFLTTHPLQLHWDITSKTELSSRNIKTESDLAQWKNARRQPETAQVSETPRPEAAAPDAAAFSMPAANAGQTGQEQHMAQQPEKQPETPAEPAAPAADPEWEQTVADQRRLDSERRAERAPWRDFPPVIRNGGLGSLKNESEYAAAKGGDSTEAVKLVNKLLKEETVQQFREMIGDRKPVIVSVSATESAGRNKIPLAMAQALGSRLDLPVDTDIQQINKVSRTGSGIDHRLAFQPVFDGRVEAGRDYLIVDDTLAVGGTVAALRGYIENRGGHVVGAGVMTAHEGALNLPVKQAMIDNISRKHGNTMDNYWKEEFGYGIDQLTQGEAGHLNAARDVEQIRDRIAEARIQGIAGTYEQTQPLSPGQQERPDGIAPEPTQAAAPDAAAFSMPAENAKQAEQEKNMAQTADTAAFDGRDFVRSLKSELEQGDFLNNPSFPVFMKADGSYLSARDDYNGLYLFVNAPEGKPVEIEFSSKTHTRNIQIDSYGKSVAEILDELKQSEPTQAAAPDTAAFSMPAANEKQTEQGQNMAQQTDNRPVYSPDNPYAAYDAEVRQNADDWEARVPLTEAMLADFNRQAEQQGYVTHIEARHASLGRFQAEKELDGRAAVIDGEFKNHGGASVYEAPRDFTVTLKQNEEEQDYFYTNSLDAALAHAETYLKERDRPIAENSTQKQAEHTSPAETRTAAPTPEAAVSASTAEQEQNMAQQTQTAVQPERPSENPARITGITLVWSEGSEDKDRRFDNFDQLQQWFEKTYRTADFDRQQGYSKNRIEVSYTRDGQEYSFPFRTDVSWTKGDFNPQREHIADHMAGALEQHGIAPETARAAKQTPQPVQEQNPAKQPGVPSENQSQTAAQTPKSGRSELREKAAKALDTAGDIMDAAALAAGAATGNFVGAAALVAASRVAEHAAGKLMEDMDKQAEKVDAASRRQEQPAPSSATQENGIEYGGSRTQDAARPEPETITVAEVQENLRRIRMAESRAATASEAAPETQARPAREQPSENARGTPVDSGREARADTGRPSENPPAEMQHEERTQPKPVLDLNYETAAGLDARYVRYDGRYLDPNNARTVLFEDKGAKIKTAREDGQTISDMLDTAQAKNWDSIRISGSHEFKRQMWLEAELRGIPNSGYSPSKEDLAMRDQMRETRERNSIEAGGLSRTGEAVQRPSERQSDPERTQTADSPSQEEEPPRGWERVFDDDAPLPSTDTAAVQSAAAEARAAADTPAEYARSEQMQGEANMATVRHNGLHGQAAAANRERQPESAALQSARAVYMQKAEKLSKTAKAQLAFYEKNMNDVFRHLDGPDLERAMTRYYESTAERMKGSHLDMPRPTQIPSQEQKNATATPAPSVKAGHETDHEIDR